MGSCLMIDTLYYELLLIAHIGLALAPALGMNDS